MKSRNVSPKQFIDGALGIIGIGVCVFIAVLWRSELHYSLQAHQPVNISNIETQQLSSHLNRYVYMQIANIDHLNASVEDYADKKQILLPVTTLKQGRIFIHAPLYFSPGKLGFSGRLRLLNDRDSTALKKFYQHSGASYDWVNVANLSANKSPTWQGQDQLTLELNFPNDLRIFMPKKIYKSLEMAKQGIEKLQLPYAEEKESSENYAFIVKTPSENTIWQHLRTLGATYQPRKDTFSMLGSQLRLHKEGVSWSPDATNGQLKPRFFMVNPNPDKYLMQAELPSVIGWSFVANILITRPYLAPGSDTSGKIFVLETQQEPAQFRIYWAIYGGLGLLIILQLIFMRKTLSGSNSLNSESA